MTVNMINSGKLKILVSNDIGYRGLDTMKVGHIINFDFPKNGTDYLHRIGRTGRLGQPGKVTNFIRKTDQSLYKRIRDCEEKDECLSKSVMRIKKK
mmetsp:Transcript_11833/g.16210  ORF Transcript_11833/g.16210 Transcript_11833/m.16210 type:complete len:96 (+) Transcript_11833:446-733(+)